MRWDNTNNQLTNAPITISNNNILLYEIISWDLYNLY